jgi:hypothetical protein
MEMAPGTIEGYNIIYNPKGIHWLDNNLEEYLSIR